MIWFSWLGTSFLLGLLTLLLWPVWKGFVLWQTVNRLSALRFVSLMQQIEKQIEQLETGEAYAQ